MATNGKYNTEQRSLAWDINRIQNKKAYLYRKWHELDAKLGHYQKKLEKTLDVHQRRNLRFSRRRGVKNGI